MHFGLVAVKAEVAQLIDALSAVWPTFELAETATLAGFDALPPWRIAKQRVVTSQDGSLHNPGTDVFCFWQDGPWAVMLDTACVHSFDRTALEALSERFGQALAFVVETTAACATFAAFEQGRRVRKIDCVDGKTVTEGERLPEEAALRRGQSYLHETEQLLAAFRIRLPGDLPADQPFIGAAFVDRTDYDARSREHRAMMVARKRASRPWWRFW